MAIYVVRAGDNVDEIARRFGIPVEQLVYDNQIDYPYRLAVGQALLIVEDENRRRDGYRQAENQQTGYRQAENGQTGYRQAENGQTGSGQAENGQTGSGQAENRQAGLGGNQDRPPLEMNGYAYPFINRQVLLETLPYLTDLSIFSYGYTVEGDLVSPAADEQWMIEEALEYRVRPMLVLTPIGEDGHFNNHLVSVLVRDMDVQQNLIRQLWEEVQAKGYGGVDVDFEYVLAEDRVPFAEFVGRLRQILNLYGYRVTVALAPKTSRDQRGLLYEGIDYRLLGEAANQVLLMTYEWGYTYGPPMAVAPIHMVRRVVEYALTEIPAYKISLGMPNYGYDWPLPYEQGVTKARSLGNREAVQLAIDYGAVIYFDEQSQSPYFKYWQYGIQHEVWFEDVRSIDAKFRLIKEFGLHGAGYWQIMRYFRPNWLLAEQEFTITKAERLTVV